MDDDVDTEGIEDVADVLSFEGGQGGTMARPGAMVMSHNPLEEESKEE